MSDGFSPHWLALREPADHAARNIDVLTALAALFRARGEIRVVDLGCGTGSNLRGTFKALPALQHWTLIDHDPRLLEAARATLRAWGDSAEERDGVLRLMKQGKSLNIRFAQADLSRGAEDILALDTQLVTAAALFDLCGAPWLTRFTDALRARKLPLYAVLTYDGRDRFEPPHPLDGAMLAAFHTDMRRDKGFGEAAGPAAAASLISALTGRGYRVTAGDSPWVLEAASPLARELAGGFVAAVKATGLVDDGAADLWLAIRRAGGTWETGHTDLLAVLP
jgi:SAM-dependent methyltransferase